MRFKDRVVVVTGAARGIGEAIAHRFADEGALLVMADVTDSVHSTVEKFCASGVTAKGVLADVTKAGDIQKMIDTAVSAFGRLDVLVNNAGIQIRCPSVDFPEADWDKLMGVNLKAVFFCSQAAARVMMAKGAGGAIVNVASATCTNTTPGRAPYVISKAGVVALTAVLGAEWAPCGIRVNAVCPGWIATDMVRDGMRLGVIREQEILSVTPLRRLASMTEIANAVIYLASDEASYVIGQSLFVDGGWSVLGIPQRLGEDQSPSVGSEAKR